MERILEVVVAGGAGVLTSFFSRMRAGFKWTVKGALLSVGFIAVSFVMAWLICKVAHLDGDMKLVVFLLAGWFGDRIVIQLDSRADELIEEVADRTADKLKEKINTL